MKQVGAGLPAAPPQSPPRFIPSPLPELPETTPWKSELDQMYQSGSPYNDILKRAAEMFASLVLMSSKLTELGSPDVPYIQKHHQTLLAVTSPGRIGTSLTNQEADDVSLALIYIQYSNPDLGGKGRADALLDALVEADSTFVDPRSPMTGGQRGGGLSIGMMDISVYKNGKYIDRWQSTVQIPKEIVNGAYSYLKERGYYVVQTMAGIPGSIEVAYGDTPTAVPDVQTEDGVWYFKFSIPDYKYYIQSEIQEERIKGKPKKEDNPTGLVDEVKLVRPGSVVRGPVGAGAGPAMEPVSGSVSVQPSEESKKPPKSDEDPTGGRRRKTHRHKTRRGKRTYRHSALKK
jgi:hypothetical protein